MRGGRGRRATGRGCPAVRGARAPEGQRGSRPQGGRARRPRRRHVDPASEGHPSARREGGGLDSSGDPAGPRRRAGRALPSDPDAAARLDRRPHRGSRPAADRGALAPRRARSRGRGRRRAEAGAAAHRRRAGPRARGVRVALPAPSFGGQRARRGVRRPRRGGPRRGGLRARAPRRGRLSRRRRNGRRARAARLVRVAPRSARRRAPPPRAARLRVPENPRSRTRRNPPRHHLRARRRPAGSPGKERSMIRTNVLALLALVPALALAQARPPAGGPVPGKMARPEAPVSGAGAVEATPSDDASLGIEGLDRRAGADDGRGAGAVPPPDTYTVKPGDTLWDLSGRFLNNPWYWPKIWSYNPWITNQHWIYPGNLLKFFPGEAEAPTRVEPIGPGTPLAEAQPGDETVAEAEEEPEPVKEL